MRRNSKVSTRLSFRSVPFFITGGHRMKDPSGTNQELIKEISIIKQRIQELEQLEPERKRVEEALCNSEEKFRTIFDRASDGILIVDAITKKFLQGNTAICSMLGYTKGEIESLTIYDIHLTK